MKKVVNVSQLLVVVALMLLKGCASVPMTGAEQDSEAKGFSPAPGKANIYVFRNETMGAALTMEVLLDGKSAGKTAAKTYFLFEVAPGSHEVASKTENTSTVQVNAQPGRNYFIWQEVKMGVMSGRSQLSVVDESTGKAAVNECKRIQSAF